MLLDTQISRGSRVHLERGHYNKFSVAADEDDALPVPRFQAFISNIVCMFVFPSCCLNACVTRLHAIDERDADGQGGLLKLFEQFSPAS